MSLVLLCATGLFLRSLESASSTDIGFRSRGILTMSVDPRVHGYTAAHTAQFLSELRRRVAALPGVVSAACTDGVPLSGGHRSDGLHVEGRPNTGGPDPTVELYMASPGYFETLGIPRIAGRDFGNETPAVPIAAIVTEGFVPPPFPKQQPPPQRAPRRARPPPT